ncbi:MAG TPA: PepSY-associated TM helix domain-containing protein [Reyranella sp.]|nr:PepSY-associated TM helix domain-containing protein [Reyranella sp.]
MEPTFRASMNWLHTWAGVVLGGILFAVFWMGTLSVFDREIDRWMKPATRLAPIEVDSIDAVARELRPLTDGAQQWSILLPTEREPVVRIGYRKPGQAFQGREVDPSTAALLPDAGTWAGTRFIYPFHYMLHLRFADIGFWFVGLAAMAMLAMCVSGVVIHRKIFADFFTFRVDRKPRRLVLDLHNLAGVLGLPFHFVITLSGLFIFFTIYFAGVRDVAFRSDRASFNHEAYGIHSRPKDGRPAERAASIDAMLAEASKLWGGAQPYFVRVWHPGDANAYVEVRRSYADAVTMNLDLAYFDAASGALLHSASAKPVMTAQRFLAGLHFIQFDHWTLRWLYFAAGLVGCVVIATGYLFWLESRRRKHAQLGLNGVRVVEGLTIGSVSGLVIATLMFLVVNRLLPLGTAFLGQDRAALEIWTFYLAWLATFAHAWARSGGAWREQCWIIATLALAAVLSNWLTTGDHLGRSLWRRHLWPVAGMDTMLFVGSAAAALAASRLGRRRVVPV